MNLRKIFALLTSSALAVSVFTACSDTQPAEEKSGDVSVSAETEAAVSDTEATREQEKVELVQSENDTVNLSGKRSRRTVVNGDDSDRFTIMVYICGTDLESECGAATADLMEMCAAEYNDNVNLLVYTGGTNNWQTSAISNQTNQIWQVETENIVCVEDDMGQKPMTDPETLTEFVSYCSENYPANRNALILWDHGGGALYGYGSDEIFNGDSMQINEIDQALDSAGVSFDFIGFDACLMATVETAYMINKHADYMIASEEAEPGIGWFYTNWLDTVCENPSVSTEEIGKIIVDDFIQTCLDEDPSDECTLSLIDLTCMDNVYDKLCSFSAGAKNQLDNNNFKAVSHSRSNSKSFGGDDYDTIDLMDFAKNLEIDESDELISAIDEAVVYSANSNNITDSNGLTVYFPYNDLESFSNMTSVYSDIGLEGEYTDFIVSFANLMTGGQLYNQSNSPISAMNGETDEEYSPDLAQWSEYDWFDADYVSENADSYAENGYSSEDLVVEDRGDYFALSLTDEDWEVISDIQMQLFYDDGEGYIDLGTDNYFEIDDDGALLVDYDGLWFSLGGYTASLYIVESGDGRTVGNIPCRLNGEDVNLVVLWDDDNDGVILGAERFYDNGMSMKGLINVNDGDVIQLVCDYYTYDDEYEDNYDFGEAFEFDSSMTVEYIPSGEGEYLLYYVITDLYQNDYYTEPVALTFDESYFSEMFS